MSSTAYLLAVFRLRLPRSLTSSAFTCRTMPKASSQPTNYALERAVNGLNPCAAGVQAIIAPAVQLNGPRARARSER